MVVNFSSKFSKGEGGNFYHKNGIKHGNGNGDDDDVGDI